MFGLPAIALLFSSAAALAQPPATVVDAQEVVGSGYGITGSAIYSPQSLVVAKNGTIYVADTANNRVDALTPALPANAGTGSAITTGAITLVGPVSLALDAAGDLFIGDTPTSTTGRVTEVMANSSGVLTASAQIIVTGSLTYPVSLTVDSTGNLYIGDCPSCSSSGSTAASTVYKVASGTTMASPLGLTGLRTGFTPSALLTDTAGHLYVADDNQTSTDGAVYIASTTGGAATPIPTGSFALNSPTGLAFDTAGDLYILTYLGNDVGANAGEQIVDIPAADSSAPYLIPNTGLGSSSALGVDPMGNIDVADAFYGRVWQFNFDNVVSLGSTAVGSTGASVFFNFEFNDPATLRGFDYLTSGDVSTELTSADTPVGTPCSSGKHDTASGGGPTVSEFYPFVCNEYVYGTPAYPGLRPSAIQVKGPSGAILSSTLVSEVGLAGAGIVYPLKSAAGATGLQQPQGLAISGLDKTTYIADTLAAAVYSVKKLNGKALTTVVTAPYVLQAPSALALNGEGDLYIADFNLNEVIVVPTTTGLPPSVLNTGGLLAGPIAMAFDSLGNLYIGNAGSAGVDASSTDPGFVVKVPVGGGTPYTLTINSVQVVFPQALAADPVTGNLYIADGGGPACCTGQVVEVPANGSAASVLSLNGVTQPAGLAFDPAEQLYVLDNVANTITVVPPAGTGSQYYLNFDNTSLNDGTSLAISAGGQSFVIAQIGDGTANTLLYLNGNASKLAFGSVKVGSQSAPMTATVANIGNETLNLYESSNPNPEFVFSMDTGCFNSPTLSPATSCPVIVEFEPTTTGAATATIPLTNSGYNSGIPIVTLTGTGK